MGLYWWRNGGGGHSDREREGVVDVLAMVVLESGLGCNMEGIGGRERACESVGRVETR